MKNKGIQKDGLIAMGGVSLCLVALVILFSQFGTNNVFKFLAEGISSLVGSIGLFALTLFIFALGMYMLLLQKLAKFKLGPSLWGVFVLILAFLIIFSFYGPQDEKVILNETSIKINPYNYVENVSDYLRLNNFASVFNQIKSNSESLPFNIKLGGGLLGFFLVGLFNNLITPVGTTIIMWLLILGGLALILNKQIKKLFAKGKSNRNNEEVSFDDEVSISAPVQSQPIQVQANPFEERRVEAPITRQDTPQMDQRVMQEIAIHNYNNSHTLKKAHFSFDDELQSDSPIEQPSFIGANKTLNSFSSFEEEKVAPVAPQVTSEPVFNNVVTESNVEPMVEAPVLESAPIEEPLPAANEPVVEENADPLYRPQPKAIVKPPFELPPLSLLDYHEENNDTDANKQTNDDRMNLINEIFRNLKVGAQAVGYVVGPSVTRFDIQTNPDFSVSSIQRYVNDISVRLGGIPTRFTQIVFGKATSGLEIPNSVRTNVGLRESIEALQSGEKFLRYIPFGKNISGDLISANMGDFPHMLVSGTTGSGKSIFVHSVIMTLLMRNTPDQLRMVLIDPKKVEMSYYNDIPHLLCPVITDPRKALMAFRKLVIEMERRYNLFQMNRVRDIGQFNKFAKDNGIQPLPYIVVFVDEYADLNDECKEIKEPVVRIAQKARSAGIHICLATQRPSVNVVDGIIKANIPTHVALMVANVTDSISIIGEAGAETLLGNGDMLVECPLISRAGKSRVQGCFVDTSEINRVCDYLRNHYGPNYDSYFLDLEDHSNDVPEPSGNAGGQVTVVDKQASEDELYEIIKGDVVTLQYCSISYIQRTYGVGFPRAGRMFNRLLKDGYVSQDHDARGSKVLIHETSEQQIGTIEQSTFVPSDNNEEAPPMVEEPTQEESPSEVIEDTTEA